MYPEHLGHSSAAPQAQVTPLLPALHSDHSDRRIVDPHSFVYQFAPTSWFEDVYWSILGLLTVVAD